MRPDILLIMCPMWTVETPPLGLAYISSYLRSKGLNVEVLDFNVRMFNQMKSEGYKDLWNDSISIEGKSNRALIYLTRKSIQDFSKKVLENPAPVIGFSIFNNYGLFFAYEIARKIKLEDSTKVIIFGGTTPYITFISDQPALFNRCVDYYIFGNGEEVIYELLETLKNKKQTVNIPGVLKYDEDSNPHFIPCVFKNNLEQLPFPTFEEFDLTEYTSRKLPILTSQGCTNKCSFCNRHALFGHYRTRKPESVLEELRFHLNYNKTNSFHFNDFLCNGKLDYLERICDLIIKANLRINWGSYAAIREDFDFNLLRKMRTAGCRYLYYGIESGSDRILQKMKKPYTARDAARVLQETKKAGILTHIFLIVGFPQETEEDFQSTLDFLKKNSSYIDQLSNVTKCSICPASDLAINYKKYGIEKPLSFTWNDYAGNSISLRRRRRQEVFNLANKIGVNTFLRFEDKKKSKQPKEIITIVVTFLSSDFFNYFLRPIIRTLRLVHKKLFKLFKLS